MIVLHRRLTQAAAEISLRTVLSQTFHSYDNAALSLPRDQNNILYLRDFPLAPSSEGADKVVRDLVNGGG